MDLYVIIEDAYTELCCQLSFRALGMLVLVREFRDITVMQN